jgi:hypothetical protein
MGIFVNGRYFDTNDYYNHEVVQERRQVEDDKRRRDQEVKRARQSAEKKRAAAKQKAKAEKEKIKAAAKEGARDDLVEKLREAEGKIGSEFEFDANKTYEQSVEERYGDTFNSGGSGAVPRLNSVFGAAPNQKVNSGRVAQDVSRRIGGPMKPTIGYQPPAVPGQVAQNGTAPTPPPLQAQQTSFLSGGAFAGGSGIKTVGQNTPSFGGGAQGSRGSGSFSRSGSGGSGGGGKLPRPF